MNYLPDSKLKVSKSKPYLRSERSGQRVGSLPRRYSTSSISVTSSCPAHRPTPNSSMMMTRNTLGWTSLMSLRLCTQPMAANIEIIYTNNSIIFLFNLGNAVLFNTIYPSHGTFWRNVCILAKLHRSHLRLLHMGIDADRSRMWQPKRSG